MIGFILARYEIKVKVVSLERPQLKYKICRIIDSNQECIDTVDVLMSGKVESTGWGS